MSTRLDRYTGPAENRRAAEELGHMGTSARGIAAEWLNAAAAQRRHALNTDCRWPGGYIRRCNFIREALGCVENARRRAEYGLPNAPLPG